VLNTGDIAPEIDAITTDGARFVLSEQRGLCTVVYFFPKAFTPGCTAETKRFRDNFAELTLSGASVVGVSTDDPETQCRFASSLRAPFPLIGDKGKEISRAFDVLWPVLGVARRVTYVVAPDRQILAAFRHEIQVKKHRDDVLKFVNDRLTAMRRINVLVK
jgi:thioredoxin-dependent peroxiredoxin